MRFTKMHGTGNDYIYVNCFNEHLPENAGELSKRFSDRHFGIGSDGMIFICPSQTADFQMIMYNADGSRSQMCGNGIRCVGKYVYDFGLTAKDEITVETLAGIKTLKLNISNNKVDTVTVDMGAPSLLAGSLPMDIADERFINSPLIAGAENFRFTAVSMGNPHIVTFVDDVHAVDIEKIGSLYENNPVFPERVNVEFVRVVNRELLEMRVWERGSGETLSCGTGACASLVAAVVNGLCGKTAQVRVLGGNLKIEWETENVFMTGEARIVFEGDAEI